MELDSALQAAVEAYRLGRVDDAEAGLRAVVAQAENPFALHNLGVICADSGRTDEAVDLYRRALVAQPDNPARHFALGVQLRTLRRFAEAEAAYRRCLELDPAFPLAAFDLGCVLLAEGRFQEGWRLYDDRPPRRRLLDQGLSFPEWRGEPLAGKSLLVWREQGYGDQIMMARFLPRLGAARITYVGLPALARLFGGLPVDYHATAADADYAAEPHDYWTLPLSIAGRLGIDRPDQLPAAPYLSGAPDARGARIGVAWRGEPTNANNRFRAMPATAAARLLALPGAISLEPADTGAADFQATADIIAGLDLVITVDTAIAHLAGAMGRPVWVLLARHALDWQWPRTGTTPWYPSARLFVQPTAGDWTGLVAQVRREAQAMFAS
jgi:tetratricopeptide (TPR) repeat protein